MCKNEHFQSSGTKNELFKVQKRKTKLMYSLRTKTIFWPLRNCSLLNQLSSPTWIACINPIFEPKVMALILWRVQVGILVRIGLRISSLNFFIKGRNSCVKMNIFKVQGRKTKLMYSLRMKTIFWPLQNCSLLNQLSSTTWITCINPIFEPKVMALMLLVRIGLWFSFNSLFYFDSNWIRLTSLSFLLHLCTYKQDDSI